MCERHCLARAGSGDDEQRPGTERLIRFLAAVYGSLALCWIQQRQVILDTLGRLHLFSPWKSLYFYTVLDGFTSSGGWFYEKFFYQPRQNGRLFEMQHVPGVVDPRGAAPRKRQVFR